MMFSCTQTWFKLKIKTDKSWDSSCCVTVKWCCEFRFELLVIEVWRLFFVCFLSVFLQQVTRLKVGVASPEPPPCLTELAVSRWSSVTDSQPPLQYNLRDGGWISAAPIGCMLGQFPATQEMKEGWDGSRSCGCFVPTLRQLYEQMAGDTFLRLLHP